MRGRLIARLRHGWKTSARNESGAAAILFAVSLILLVPMLLGVFEIYYGSEQRGKLQDSLDAAALFAARSTAITDADLTTVGRAALDANLKLSQGAVLKSAEFKAEGQKVVAVAKLQPASLMGTSAYLWRYPEMTVTTEVNRAMDKLEVALVLDNTGSMQDVGSNKKISVLQTAAKDLVEKLKTASARSTEVDPIKIALVPFSNTVRVQSSTPLTDYNVTTHTGTGIPSWIDPMGKAHQVDTTNYDNFTAPNTDRLALMKYMTRSGAQLKWEGCVEARRAPYDVQEDEASTGTPATMYVPWFWPDEPDQTSKFKPTGSTSWYAGSYNDYIDDILNWSSATAYAVGDLVIYTPPTWSSATTYSNGDRVTYSGAIYKAKNVTGNKNKTPGANTTYWASDSNGTTWRAKTANTNKLPGGLNVTEWETNDHRDAKARQLNTPKYGSTVSGTPLKNTGTTQLDSTAYGVAGSYTYGPNMGCSLQPVIRLTTDLESVKTAIDGMKAVGETNIALGLAWGWHSLSPNGPFKDGQSYTKDHNRKIIILMTDGENTMNNPSKTAEPNGSYYGGYGFIWQKMLGITSGDAGAKIDDRLETLCTNVKKKGIVIYTIRVEVTSGTSTLLQNCATTPDKFYDVQDISDLGTAFDAIARSIDNLRISK